MTGSPGSPGGPVEPDADEVDIVVATNRNSPFFAATVESVLAQTHSRWRMLVVDDGIPDPAALAALLADPRITLVPGSGAGVSSARNLGLRRADAPLVVFLDDDDIWASDRLTRQVAELAAHPEALGVCSGGYYLDADGRTLGDGWSAPPATREDHLAGLVPLPRITTLMLRREACERAGGFDEGLRLAEDLDLVLRVLRAGAIRSIDRRLVGYRRHEGNATLAPDVRQQQITERVLRRAARVAEAEGARTDAELLRRHLARYRRRAAHEWARRAVMLARARRPCVLAADTAWSFSRAPGSAALGAWQVARTRWPRGRSSG